MPKPIRRRLTLSSNWFWIILGTSLIIKGIFFYKLSPFPHRFYTPDSHLYKTLADNIIKHQRFATVSREGELFPETMRTPVYPIFLAVISLCSVKSFPFPYSVAVIQIILSSLTCGLVYLSGKRLFSQTAAVIAGFLSTLDITSSVLPSILLSDSLFVFLFFCSLYFMITGIVGHRKRRLGAAGMFLGLACLCRPIGLYTGLIFAGFFIRYRKKISIHKALFFFLPFFLLIGSWKARNYLQTGSPAFSNQSYFYMVGVASAIKSKAKKQSFRQTETDFMIKIVSLFQQENPNNYEIKKERKSLDWRKIITETQVQRLCRDTLFEQIALHPSVFAENYLKNLARIIGEPDYISYLWCYNRPPGFRLQWSADRLLEIVRNQPGLFLVLSFQLANLLLLWGGFAYGVLLSSEKRWWAVLLAAIVLYFTLATSLLYLEARFRMPLIPVLALGAGYGLYKLLSGSGKTAGDLESGSQGDLDFT